MLNRVALAIIVTALVTASAAAVAHGPPWDSSVQKDHPLVGKIWRTAEQRFVPEAEVIAAVQAANFVLLGEKHDNADHHRIQAWLLGRVIAHGRRPAVAFEMLNSDQEPALARHLAGQPRDAAGIAAAVDWAASGWPDWELYQPIAQVALEADAPLLAASLPRKTVRSVFGNGIDALGADRAANLGLDRELPPAEVRNLRREVIASHCDQLPDTMIDPMVEVTRIKDAVMADALLRGDASADTDGAVLIAGNGHVRSDRGVPWHLRARAPERSTAVVGLLEVFAGETDPGAYAASFHAAGLPFDFVWFTPRVDDKDPCAVYEEQLRRAKERHLKQRSD